MYTADEVEGKWETERQRQEESGRTKEENLLAVCCNT